ncbi:hypothetical protein DITRI_Ditri06bG0096500 [Diplodiscus trichospermus]
MGMPKFNVDGASLGKPGRAGIRGILRDHLERQTIIFSKAVGVVDSNTAKYLAMLEAFSLFLASLWGANHSLLIEIDSTNIVKWITEPSKVPWRLRRYVSRVEFLKTKCREWKIMHTYREGNDIADGLAKVGIIRSKDFLIVYKE